MKLVIDISEEDYKNVSRIVDMGLGTNVDEAIKNGTPLSTLTDSEQRLFLSAMSREEKVCESIDEDKVVDNDVRLLVPLCENIERKVKEVLF